MGLWDRLSPAWRACWEEGWAAYCPSRNYPIGAAVVAADGRVLSRGRNHIAGRHEALAVSDHELAHAEVNALLAMGHVHPDPSVALYTLLEPCPLCIGAFYMSGVRQLHYAARDPLAGSAALLGTTRYMAVKPIRVHAAIDAALEAAYVPVLVAAMHEVRGAQIDSLLEHWSAGYPDGVAAGRALYEAGVLAAAREQGLSAAQALARVEAALGLTTAG